MKKCIKNKSWSMLAIALVAMLSLQGCAGINKENENKYNLAIQYCNEGKYKESYELFKELGDYKDSTEQVEKFFYLPEKIVFTNTNGIVYTYLYEYDDKGNNTKEKIMDSEGYETQRVYEYDAKNNIINQRYIYNDGSENITEYKYNSNNKVTNIVYISGGSRFEHEYEWSENGRKATYLYKAVDNDISSEYKYEYDERGNLIREEQILDNGDKIITEWEYDENDNTTKLYKNEQDNETEEIYEYEMTYENEYDERGTLIKTTSFENGKWSSENFRDINYDDNGKMIKEVATFKLDEEVYVDEIQYDYDDNGNLIMKKTIDSQNQEYKFEISDYKLYYNADGREITSIEEIMYDIERV